MRDVLARFAGLAVVAGLAVPPAMAQTDSLVETVETFVADFATGLPDYFAEHGNACLLDLMASLPEEEREIIAGAGGLIDGVNALVAARPEAAQGLFSGLDHCLNTIVAGEMMLDWVEERWAEAPEGEREDIARCMLGAVAGMMPDAKLGVIHFRFGDFGDAIIAMQDERPDLSGTFMEDAAGCGVISFAPQE